MPRRIFPVLLATLALAVVLAACGSGEGGTVTKQTVMRKARPGSGKTYLPAATTERRLVRPATYRFGGDGDLTARGLAWHGWGEAKATAFGTIAEHPANGLVDTFSGSVTASAPRRCDGARYYTEVMAHVPKQADYVPSGPTKLSTPCD